MFTPVDKPKIEKLIHASMWFVKRDENFFNFELSEKIVPEGNIPPPVPFKLTKEEFDGLFTKPEHQNPSGPFDLRGLTLKVLQIRLHSSGYDSRNVNDPALEPLKEREYDLFQSECRKCK